MMDTKFTPGPWSLAQESTPADDYGYWYHRIIAGHGHSGNGFDICGIINPHDAHLMSAAPELYAALETAIEEINHLRKFAGDNGAMIDDTDFVEGINALAKARGEA